MKVKDARNKVRIIDDTSKALSKLESFLSKNKDNLAESDSLADKPDDDIVILDDLRENDLLIKLNELQTFVDESEDLYFNDVELSQDTSKLASDGIKVLKQLINSGI